MKIRVISAVIMILIGGALIYFGGLAMSIAVFLFSCVGLFEFYRAFKNKGVRPLWLL